jgi:hypothetical protein
MERLGKKLQTQELIQARGNSGGHEEKAKNIVAGEQQFRESSKADAVDWPPVPECGRLVPPMGYRFSCPRLPKGPRFASESLDAETPVAGQTDPLRDD